MTKQPETISLADYRKLTATKKQTTQTMSIAAYRRELGINKPNPIDPINLEHRRAVMAALPKVSVHVRSRVMAASSDVYEMLARERARQRQLKNPDRKCKAQPESIFQSDYNIVKEALGWLQYHTHNSKRSNGGFLDNTALNADRTRFLVSELKVGDNKPTEGQLEWAEAWDAWFKFMGIPKENAHVAIWYPEDWGEILAILQGDDNG
ncbi:MAG: hypothetical protein AAF267_17855 [Deinococcota bacterium]